VSVLASRLRARAPGWITIAAIVAAVIAAAGAVARQQGIPRYWTVWAEDGQVFGQCAVDGRGVQCLITPYDGWIHVVPRTLAWVASLLPVAIFAPVVTLMAAAVTAACALLLARAVGQVTGSPLAGLMSGAALTLVEPASEVAGNLTNLHWILLVATAVIVVCEWLGRRLGRADVGLLLATIASSPFGLLFVPLLGFGAILHRGAPPWLAIAVLLMLVQLFFALTSPRNETPDTSVSISAPIGWYRDFVVADGVFGRRTPLPDAIVAMGTLLALIGLAWAAARSAEKHRWPRSWPRAGDPWVSALAVIALVGSGAAVFAASTYLNRHVIARYQYVPVALSVVTLCLAVGRLQRALRPGALMQVDRGSGASGSLHPGRGWRRQPADALIVVVVLILTVAFVPNFRMVTRSSPGPDYRTAFADATSGCDPDVAAVDVPISPLPSADVTTTWKLRVPCARVDR
jgi:hypothetical protein